MARSHAAVSVTANPIIAAAFALMACSEHTPDTQSNDIQSSVDPLGRNPAAIPATADHTSAPVILAQATEPVAPPVAQTRTAAGGPRGDGLKAELQAGRYPGIVKTTLDGVNQTAYLTGESQKSAREVFYYFSGATPSAVRYRNWKMYYTMSQPGAAGWILPLVPFHFTLVQNIKRDPFEQSVGTDAKTVMGIGGALSAPSTAFIYDWNMLPIGQQLWLEWFRTLQEFPPLQKPASYNLTQVMEQVKEHQSNPSD